MEPSVKMGKPNLKDGFKLLKSGDIDVYIKTGVTSKKNKIEISLSRIFWIKQLNVTGVSI